MVTCTKHIFEAPYVVLQFDVVNTIPEQRLRGVRVRVDGEGQVGGSGGVVVMYVTHSKGVGGCGWTGRGRWVVGGSGCCWCWWWWWC